MTLSTIDVPFLLCHWPLCAVTDIHLLPKLLGFFRKQYWNHLIPNPIPWKSYDKRFSGIHLPTWKMSNCESKGLVVCSATMLKYEFYLSVPTTLTQMLMNLWIQQDFRQVFFCLQKPIVISTRLTGRQMNMWINQKTLLPTEMLLKFYAKYSWDLIRRSVISLLWTMLMEQGSEWTGRISFSQVPSLGANTRGGMTGCFMGASDLCLIVLTVYPKKYAHGFCFAVLCCGYTLTDFPISIRLTSLALWQSNDFPSASKATLMNMDKYFMWIHYERLHNHNKAKHNKTVCIFLGIYCSSFKVIITIRDWFMDYCLLLRGCYDIPRLR